MYKSFSIILALITLSASGQKNPTQKAQPIVEEGKLLYKHEMASWYGTDLFIEQYNDRENIGGYFSYLDNDTARCVFYSRSESPMVIGTISFDSTYDVTRAIVILKERKFTNRENDLFQIRKIALEELQSNEDGFFTFYENTRPNLIPLIHGKEKKVYILCGPQESGVVIFGNDYLLTFDKKNRLKDKKQLHKNIIPIEYGNAENGTKEEIAMHSHLPETGNFMTATDICTLMLYSKFTNWKSHNVVSKKYLNIWNCETNELIVVPMDMMQKINENEKKQKK